MRAGFDHGAFLQHQDPVGVLHGGQAMGDRDHGPALPGAFKRFLNFMLGLAVECAGGLIQKQDRRVLQHRPSDADPLLLAAGQF